MTFDAATSAPQAAESGAPAPRAAARFWTTREVAALRANYPALGAAGCAPLLPGRGLSAIHAKAASLRLRAPAPKPDGKVSTRYPSTPELDAEIRAVYALAKRGAVKAFAERIGRPPWWVHRRAVDLGVTNVNGTRPGDWKPAELVLLERYSTCTPQHIAAMMRRAGFERTPTAIVGQLKRRRVDRLDPDTWTTSELATVLGVDHDTITRWVKQRGLKTSKEANNPHGTFVFERKAVRAWVSKNRRLVSLKKVDPIWFMDLAFGALHGGRS